MDVRRVLWRMMCALVPYAPWRHRLLRNRRDLVRVIDESGHERRPRLGECRRFFVTESPEGEGNLVRVHCTSCRMRLNVDFHGQRGRVEIAAGVCGTVDVSIWDADGFLRVGARTSCGHAVVNATGSGVEIGSDCLMADHVMFYAGDAHTLLDRQTGAVRNANPAPIVVGKHCWLGLECVFTKSSRIADETVVGLRAVVTKRFDESFTALAGCPAKVVSRDIGWNGATPGAYGGRHG